MAEEAEEVEEAVGQIQSLYANENDHIIVRTSHGIVQISVKENFTQVSLDDCRVEADPNEWTFDLFEDEEANDVTMNR